jgi:hypothetical protein
MSKWSNFLTAITKRKAIGLITLVGVIIGCISVFLTIPPLLKSCGKSEIDSGKYYAEPGNTPQTTLPTVPGKTYVIRDDFSGPLLWEEQSDLPGPGRPQPPQISKKIKIEDQALHIFAESWWYSAYAIRTFSELKDNFTASCSFRIMPDSADTTNLSMIIGYGNSIISSNKFIGIGYDGYLQTWIASLPDLSRTKFSAKVDKDRWNKIEIRRTDNIYEFFINDINIYQSNFENNFIVDHIILGTGVGIHQEGGTHVSFDDVELYYY